MKDGLELLAYDILFTGSAWTTSQITRYNMLIK